MDLKPSSVPLSLLFLIPPFISQCYLYPDDGWFPWVPISAFSAPICWGTSIWLSLPIPGAGPAYEPWWPQLRGHVACWMGACSTGRAFFHGAVVILCFLLSPIH